MILLGCIPAIVVEWRLAVSATNLSQRWSDTQNHFRMIGWHTHTHQNWNWNHQSAQFRNRTLDRTFSTKDPFFGTKNLIGRSAILGQSMENHPQTIHRGSLEFCRAWTTIRFRNWDVSGRLASAIKIYPQWMALFLGISAMNGFVLRYMVPYRNDWDDSKWHPNSWLGWYISYYYLHSSPFYPYLLVGSFFIIFGLHQGTKVSDTWWRSPWLQTSNTWTWPDKNATDPTKQQPACDHERDQATKYRTSPPNWATQLPHAETTILTKEYQGVYGEVYNNPWVAQGIPLMGHRPSFNLAKPKGRWFLSCQQNTIRCACVLKAGSKAAIKP